MNPFQDFAFYTVIESAITTQQVIQLKLGTTWRTVEPYQVGTQNHSQKSLFLYGYCRDVVTGKYTTSRWQLFEVAAIQQIDVTMYYFQPQADYPEQNTEMCSVLCQLPTARK